MQKSRMYGFEIGDYVGHLLTDNNGIILKIHAQADIKFDFCYVFFIQKQSYEWIDERDLYLGSSKNEFTEINLYFSKNTFNVEIK